MTEDEYFRIPANAKAAVGKEEGLDSEINHAPTRSYCMQYMLGNGPMPTTAAFAKVTSGTAVEDHASGQNDHSCQSFRLGALVRRFSSRHAGEVELIETGIVFGTVTAYATAEHYAVRWRGSAIRRSRRVKRHFRGGHVGQRLYLYVGRIDHGGSCPGRSAAPSSDESVCRANSARLSAAASGRGRTADPRDVRHGD